MAFPDIIESLRECVGLKGAMAGPVFPHTLLTYKQREQRNVACVVLKKGRDGANNIKGAPSREGTPFRDN